MVIYFNSHVSHRQHQPTPEAAACIVEYPGAGRSTNRDGDWRFEGGMKLEVSNNNYFYSFRQN